MASILTCFEIIMLYFFLLPIPSAAPVFLGLFALTLWLSGKPCKECMLYCFIVFLALSPTSPFVSTPSANSISSFNTTTTPPSLTDARPGRTWYTLNNGNIFNPSLVGYDTRRSSRSSGSGSSVSQLQTDQRTDDPVSLSPSSSNTPQTLPKGYYDLRWRGIGLVLDLSPSRTEEGLRWEGHTGPPPPPPGSEDISGNSDGDHSEQDHKDDGSDTEASTDPEDPVFSVRGELSYVLDRLRTWAKSNNAKGSRYTTHVDF